MDSHLKIKKAHAIDILGNVIGRDQQIMTILKACNMISILDEDTFLDNQTVFFDPFCKAGELLLSCAFYSCWFKCAKNKKNLTIESVQDELFKSIRYFGLAPDERHFRLSLRTFLGNTYSHDKKYNHIIRDGHYLSESDGRLNLDKYKKEFDSMIEYINKCAKPKKIIAVGNPPYQESDSGFGKSARSIYDLFVESHINSDAIQEFVFVIPARWFGGGKGLDKFRQKMMTSGKIKNLVYFSNSSDVFPTVDINGGVCFFHYDKKYNGLTNFTDGTYSKKLDLSEFDIIPDDPKAYDIVRKILMKWNGKYVGDIAWSRKPFGLATDYFTKNKESSPKGNNIIPCLSRNKVTRYIERSKVNKNVDHINLWKVSVPAVAGGSRGNRRSTVPKDQIFIIPKGTISTETYSIIDTFESKIEAENLVDYLKTDFARYLLGLRKITQHIPKDRWNWVPYVDVSKRWSDEKLAKLFELTDAEIKHIKAKVEEWS